MTQRVKSARALLQAYKTMQASPNERFDIGLNWRESWDFADLCAWFGECLTAKINREDARQGRYFTTEYQQDLRHDVSTIRDYARGVHHPGCSGLLHTHELQARYPHINRQQNED